MSLLDVSCQSKGAEFHFLRFLFRLAWQLRRLAIVRPGTVDKVYPLGHIHANTIGGYWSLFKAGLRGVYRNVSDKYLQTCFNEYSFRYNRRHDDKPMPSMILNTACGFSHYPLPKSGFNIRIFCNCVIFNAYISSTYREGILT